MAEIVNLRTARKRRNRAEKERKAEENRALHGRTRAEKTAQTIERRRDIVHLDGHRTGQPARSGEEGETP